MLVLAEACNPDWASVPLIGWRGTESLSRVAGVHLVTQIRNRDAIEARSPTFPRTYVDTEDLAGPLYKLALRLRGGTGGGWTLNALQGSLAYRLFERRAWALLGDRIRAGEFDVVHRLTPVSPGFTSSMAGRCAGVGVPFVLGPLNGGVPWPRGFEAERARERERLGGLRRCQRLLPGYRATRRHAAAILVGSTVAMNELSAEHRSKALLVPENAVYERDVISSDRRFDDATLRVVFVGRLVPLKGVGMLLEAVRRLDAGTHLQLEIVGDGPERAALERDAAGLSNVRFAGQLPHTTAMERIRGAHVLALPSIREFGGGVVVEAMASGTVPIVIDYGGPRDLVAPGAGVRVPLTDRQGVIAGLAAALAQAALDRPALEAMSRHAVAHVRQHLTWESRSRLLLQIYQRLITPGGHAHRPGEEFSTDTWRTFTPSRSH